MSTSDFSLRKSLLTFVILILVHRGLVSSAPSLKATTIPRTADWARFGVEQALEIETGDFVGVGSSELGLIQLAPPWSNLSVPGRGPMSSLELLEVKNELPKYALIESNWIVRPSDTAEILEKIDSELFGVSYRERPSLMLWTKLSPKLGFFMKNGNEPQDYEKKLLIASTWHQEVDNAENRNKAISTLKQLEEKGVTLLFVRMPEDPVLEALECQISSLKLLKREFPPTRYLWIEPKPETEYVTFDGLHLDNKSRKKFGSELNETLQKHLSP